MALGQQLGLTQEKQGSGSCLGAGSSSEKELEVSGTAPGAGCSEASSKWKGAPLSPAVLSTDKAGRPSGSLTSYHLRGERSWRKCQNLQSHLARSRGALHGASFFRSFLLVVSSLFSFLCLECPSFPPFSVISPVILMLMVNANFP